MKLQSQSERPKERQNEAQRQLPAHHFQREKCAPEWHAVSRSHARSSPASYQQASLFVGKTFCISAKVGENRARLFKRTLAAHRCTHTDRKDRQNSAAESAQRRHASGVKPDRCSRVDSVATRELLENKLAKAGQNPCRQQNNDVPPRTGVPRSGKYVCAGSMPDDVLDYSSSRVSAAGASPVLTPMRQTASQNRSAPGCAWVVGIDLLPLVPRIGIQTSYQLMQPVL